MLGTRRFMTLGFAAVCVVAVISSSASAQTTANGPYYATPSWDQTIPTSTRFIVLSNFGGAAVLDRETGIVWERWPSNLVDTWFNSLDACARLSLGFRKGWRLPSVHELASLLETGIVNAGSPALPAGHPFIGVQLAQYWTASIRVNSAPWVVNLQNGAIDFVDRNGPDRFRWCVRGGQNHARDY